MKTDQEETKMKTNMNPEIKLNSIKVEEITITNQGKSEAAKYENHHHISPDERGKEKQLHERKKSSKCKLCDYIVSNKSSMNRHVATVHERKKTFTCDFCDCRSFYKSVITRHVAVVHDKIKPFHCKFCDYTSSRKYHVNQHIAAVHERKKNIHV